MEELMQKIEALEKRVAELEREIQTKATLREIKNALADIIDPPQKLTP